MSEWPLAGDLNRDGRVDFADLSVVLDQWLEELPIASGAVGGPNALQPNPARCDIDGQPHEVHGGGGVFDWYVEMTATEVVSPHGPVEYYFDSEVFSDFDSGWQTSRSCKVLMGRSGQGLEFHVRARDQAGNITEWSDWTMAQMRT